MKFFVAFAATLACALAYVPSPYYGYVPAPAPAPYARAYAHPPAQITVLPSGFLADTPEVAAARTAHLAEKTRISATPAPVPAPAPAPYAPAAYPYAIPAPYARAYAHPPAQITVLPSGYLADTPEVAAARTAHLAEKARIAAKPAPVPAPAPYVPYVAPAYPYAAPAYPYHH